MWASPVRTKAALQFRLQRQLVLQIFLEIKVSLRAHLAKHDRLALIDALADQGRETGLAQLRHNPLCPGAGGRFAGQIL
ncbi:MAG TPA: hypothetical protein VG099_22325, partial [Gemmataceae bacterium]|nr:hypothetical protein [Gemmataceae bacterium]